MSKIISTLIALLTCYNTSDIVFAQDRLSRFDEITQIVVENFYSPAKIESVFKKIVPEYRLRVSGSTDENDFTTQVDGLLDELQTSHTSYYTTADPEYYQLAAIFGQLPNIRELFAGREVKYATIGILTSEFEGKTFVISVFAGSSAQTAGVLTGDEIIAVDGQAFRGVESFSKKIGVPVALTLRRQEGAVPTIVAVTPELRNPKQEFLAAQQASIRVIEHLGRKIGYIHVWSYAGIEYQEAFQDAISFGALKDADGLIWDLRDGWGGASAAYLNVFNKQVPFYTRIDRDGSEHVWDGQWRKPVVMLINGGVRSGKEILAYGFKKYKLGKIVGENTAGAVTAGKLFILSDDSILYLAVGGARIDGDVLEGVGVAPDVHVRMDIRYLAGKDIQLDRAVSVVTEMVEDK